MLEQNITVTCPYCGAENLVTVDLTAIADEFVEDCQTCCAPIHYTAVHDNDREGVVLFARKENG